MSKIELHVHLEGAVQSDTLLKLAKKNNVALPVDSIEDLSDWYRFTGFDNFL